MLRKPGALLMVGILLLVASAGATMRVKDPGVRGGPAGAGGPLSGLTSAELAFFQAGLAAFGEGPYLLLPGVLSTVMMQT